MDGTGNCYEVHAKYLMDTRMLRKDCVDNMKLVHGKVVGQGPIEGIVHGHCWIEIDEDKVYDKANNRTVLMDRDAYYRIGNIKEKDIKRYTYKEMTKMLLETEHYGPWD